VLHFFLPHSRKDDAALTTFTTNAAP
jgi:hypothetical protein